MENTGTNTEFNKAYNKASRVVDDVSTKASEVTRDVRDVADKAKEKFTNAASEAADSSNQAFNKAGETLASVATRIKENAPEGKLGTAANSLADTLEASGNYMANHKIGDLTGELTGVIKKHPVQSLWIGFGLGVLIGTTLSKR